MVNEMASKAKTVNVKIAPHEVFKLAYAPMFSAWPLSAGTPLTNDEIGVAQCLGGNRVGKGIIAMAMQTRPNEGAHTDQIFSVLQLLNAVNGPNGDNFNPMRRAERAGWYEVTKVTPKHWQATLTDAGQRELKNNARWQHAQNMAARAAAKHAAAQAVVLANAKAEKSAKAKAAAAARKARKAAQVDVPAVDVPATEQVTDQAAQQ